MAHISDIDLERLLDDNLSLLAKIVARKHLDECGECAKHLEEAKDRRVFLKKMQSGLTALVEADHAVEHSKCETIQALRGHGKD